MAQLSVIVDPKDIRDIDAAIEELIAIKNRLAANEAFQEVTGMQYSGVQDISTWGVLPTVSADPVQEALDDLWPRLGLRLRKLMKAAAAHTEPYTTADLATALDTDLPTAKSWRANLGRSLNAVGRNHPDAPAFFEQHPQPGGGWHYSVHPAYRDLVRDRDLHEPFADGTIPQ